MTEANEVNPELTYLLCRRRFKIRAVPLKWPTKKCSMRDAAASGLKLLAQHGSYMRRREVMVWEWTRRRPAGVRVGGMSLPREKVSLQHLAAFSTKLPTALLLGRLAFKHLQLLLLPYLHNISIFMSKY